MKSITDECSDLNPKRSYSGNSHASGDTGDLPGKLKHANSASSATSPEPDLESQLSLRGARNESDTNTQKDTESIDSLSCDTAISNLIVNYLPPYMSQEEVKALFSSVGEVESCKLVREKNTGESLGYAFVKFVRASQAQTAVNRLNGLRLQNKTIKVSLARPSSESIKGANLYICGLPKRMTQTEIETLFGQFGKIITARILYDSRTGISRGVAFIRFDKRNEAEQAIRHLNGYRPVIEYSESVPVEPIIVKFANSPTVIKQENLSMALLKQAIQGTSNLSKPNSYNPFRMPNYFMNQFFNSALMASTAVGVPGTGWCLFVYNLAPETEESDLWQLFGPFGAVQSVKLNKDHWTQKCRGFGFVNMTNFEDAQLALQSLNGVMLGDRCLQVTFKHFGAGANAGSKPRGARSAHSNNFMADEFSSDVFIPGHSSEAVMGRKFPSKHTPGSKSLLKNLKFEDSNCKREDEKKVEEKSKTT